MGLLPTQTPARVDLMTARQEIIAGYVLNGWSQRRIGEHLGISQSRVSQEMVRVRKIWRQEMAQSYDDHVARAIARYAQLAEALEPGLKKHDWKSIDTAIRLEDRVAKLLGLDMPTQHEIHITVEEIDKEIARLEGKIIDAEVVEETAPLAITE